MLIYLRVLKESFNFAINALRTNKLRTFLSLLGVTIGIFSIIAVLAAVDSLKGEIDSAISGLDNRTIYVGHMSFGPTDIPRWKWEQYPTASYEEFQYLRRNLPNTAAISYTLNVPAETVKAGGRSVENVGIGAVTDGYYNIEDLRLVEGRYFNELESNNGSYVIVLGHEISESLFDSPEMAIGKSVRLYGRKFTVIGVLEKEGFALGDSKDTAVLFPVNILRKMYGTNNKSLFPFIIVMPDKSTDEAEYIALLKQKLRLKRGLKAEDEDNFFINQFSGFTNFIDEITGTMNLIGGVISLFSLLVGGFGIANIMFVSVKERTNLIGIQKSLGAKRKFILYQFLFEAMILAIIGGIIGLFLVFIASLIASAFTEDFKFVLSLTNIIIGTAIAAIIGLISGILPAIKASKLDPVEAIRTGY